MKLLKDAIIICRVKLVIIILIVFFSCDSLEDSTSIDITRNQNLSVFDVFSDVTVVKLQASEGNHISKIRKIEYYNSCYYILDQRAQQLFCFKDDGKFVFKINSQGKGMGEYNYITDFSIDKKNKQIILLDPAVQRVHFFDLNGKFVKSHNIKSDKVLGLNRVYPFKDSVLILTSITYENLHFYSLNEERVIFADYNFNVPTGLHAFSPLDNIFFFDSKVLFQVPLDRDIIDVSSMVPEPYFTWCFGDENNSKNQINDLLHEIASSEEAHKTLSFPFQAVGKDKILNYHIIKSFENKRFRIAVLEYDNDFKFVLIDKNNNQNFVFNTFFEGIRLPYEHIQSDRIITFYEPELSSREKFAIEREGWQHYYFERNHILYLPDIVDGSSRQIIEDHNPMTDNPFLVVYKFRE